MKALILSAGQGKRLLPLTAETPKALLDIHGRSLLARQVEALIACGIDEVVVVAGFQAHRLEEALSELRLCHPQVRFRLVHNPFYTVADNLGSCWVAREEFDRDCLLINGDTLFEEAVVRRLCASILAPLTVAIDHKAHYDDDDMKVRLAGRLLVDIGKSLPRQAVDGEAIGMILFRGKGPDLFRAAVAAAMRHPDALRHYYLSVVRDLAATGVVETQAVAGLTWCEIDFPLDLARAGRLFGERETERPAATPALASAVAS
jgi:choline kinase